MRHIKRFPKPDILVRKAKEWTDAFLISEDKRPHNSKYGHHEILENLKSMSFHKCFYCETLLKGHSNEIDHYIEVAEDRTLAFNWENLYLSCENCNNKLPNKTILATETLNPCVHTDAEIEKHITFEGGIIKSIDEVGLKTIQKFKLDSLGLDDLRKDRLIQFHRILLQIIKNRDKENRKALIEKEKNALKSFAQANAPFSFMFKIELGEQKDFLI